MESKSIEMDQRSEESSPVENQDCHSVNIASDLYSEVDAKLAREKIVEFWIDMGQLQS